MYFVAAYAMDDERKTDGKTDLLIDTVFDIKSILKNQSKEIKSMQYEISQIGKGS